MNWPQRYTRCRTPNKLGTSWKLETARKKPGTVKQNKHKQQLEQSKLDFFLIREMLGLLHKNREKMDKEKDSARSLKKEKITVTGFPASQNK